MELNPIRNRRGQAIVELALILPVLLYLLIFSLYAFLVLSDYLTLQSMAREAARLGAVNDQIVWATNYYHDTYKPAPGDTAGQARYDQAQRMQKEVQEEINRMGTLHLYALDRGGTYDASEDGEMRRNGLVTVSIRNVDMSGVPYIRVEMTVRRKDNIPNILGVFGKKGWFFPPAFLNYGCETPLERARTYYDTNP